MHVAPYAVVLTAVGAAWVGHAAEYVRLWGWSGFGTSTARSVHTYMGPTGLVLLALATVGVQAGLRSFRRLEAQLAQLKDGTLDPRDASSHRRRRYPVPVLSLGSMLFGLQLVLYVVQENAEEHALGIHRPAVQVLTGQHLWAPVVLFAVALAAALVLWLLHRPLARIVDAVRRAVAWLVAHQRRLGSPTHPGRAVRTWTPAERWGRQRWCRPPPAAVAA